MGQGRQALERPDTRLNVAQDCVLKPIAEVFKDFPNFTSQMLVDYFIYMKEEDGLECQDWKNPDTVCLRKDMYSS